MIGRTRPFKMRVANDARARFSSQRLSLAGLLVRRVWPIVQHRERQRAPGEVPARRPRPAAKLKTR
ncbi:hypothetical protein T484DRAFT_2183561 [Baffinella frigidus]|nr:hypothetical protein T484DRAFT_2183561 [Cryptophyta sp. CCMP2293]